jgi:hypothetical protein
MIGRRRSNLFNIVRNAQMPLKIYQPTQQAATQLAQSTTIRLGQA